MMKKSEVQGLL